MRTSIRVQLERTAICGELIPAYKNALGGAQLGLAHRQCMVNNLIVHNHYASITGMSSSVTSDRKPSSSVAGVIRLIARLLLGAALTFAGISHLSFSRQEFRAQVPAWIPIDEDLVVLGSGVVEIALGLALLFAIRRWQPIVGVVAAAFFIAVFPGNIGQWREHVDAFGLDTDSKRLTRLFFQPLLIAIALWSTGGWSWLRDRSRR